VLRAPRFLGLHAEPSGRLRIALAVLPFVLLIAGYLVASDLRIAANPDDKLLPSPAKMAEASMRMAFEADKRTSEYLLWVDTLASLRRLALGAGLAATFGLLLGLNMGLFPGMRALGLPFVTFVSIIPPLAVLPILFITFGVDELAKVVLIFLGSAFVITRDTLLAVRALPYEQITKALTLGATSLAVVYRVVLPQIVPRLVDAVRLSLGAGWLFLIAAEAVASTDGLGYRIFLVRRYLAMDVIIPYVLWLTFLGFAIDYGLRRFVAWRYPWYEATKG
jgi:NitT/TauT family transport system permease protein